jgi:hypothetical protein
MHIKRGSLRLFALLSLACALPACGDIDPADMEELDSELAGSNEQALVNAPGADLRITNFSQTTQTFVDGFQQFSVTVKNFGTADSNPTTLTIALLETQTSPQTYLLGSLQAVPSGCTLAGRNLTCALGRLRYNGQQAGRQRTINFGYKIPVTTQALALTASATGVGEPPANATDNSASLTAAQNFRAVTVTAGTKTPSHCTGTTLSAYFECLLFPSSITSHQAQYQLGGTITFQGTTVYSGTWSQPDPTRLHFEYSNGNYSEVVFDGRSADPGCFEGISHFFDDPDPQDNIPPVQSSYLAPYRICF